MKPIIDRTHDATRTSWVASANDPDTDFPIQNLPFGVFSDPVDDIPRIGVAIGDQILDLTTCVEQGLGDSVFATVDEETLQSLFVFAGNDVADLSPASRRELRHALSDALWADHPDVEENKAILSDFLFDADSLQPELPFEIGDYTDFYASVFHATNVGSMFRPDNPLLPNYKYIPIGYHGRASSIVISGTEIRRPHGQIRPNPDAPPEFAPTRSLDYELEMGIFVSGFNELGKVLTMEEAEARIFGLCLLNDWSARDMQAWEYQPLGPFLAKNFATSISPWVVTAEALAPFRTPAFSRPEGDPAPLAYLDGEFNRNFGGFDVTLEVFLLTERMRKEGLAPFRLSRGGFKDLYWTPAQMLAHHASNGCNLRPGDLLGSGTVSGPEKESRGCLLELTWRGAEPLTLPTGETRKFLETGDEVIFRGFCERDGFRRIGFGECRGIIS
jgi:fumarylacetoacetase